MKQKNDLTERCKKLIMNVFLQRLKADEIKDIHVLSFEMNFHSVVINEIEQVQCEYCGQFYNKKGIVKRRKLFSIILVQ